MIKNNLPITIFWFRRDLRINDNIGFYSALRSGNPILPLFIFDTNILDKLEDWDDARVNFIYNLVQDLQLEFSRRGSSLIIRYGKPVDIFKQLLQVYNIVSVYTNHDYEPYALRRETEISALLKQAGISLFTFKDHVIFEGREIVNGQEEPYKIFTPYSKKWLSALSDEQLKEYPSQLYLNNLYQTAADPSITLQEIGFKNSTITIPPKEISLSILESYAKDRDFPARQAATRIGIHLRFGTISIREAVRIARQYSDTWLNELIWREFYIMLLTNNPHLEHAAAKPAYDFIQWRNNEEEFERWCTGQTGYPIVDAGIRQLNQTGYMHNRVRMITASFLVKHLLIDWRWGEAYFARKLLDYEMATNNGSWQWIAGSGCDAAPYFRVFSPNAQAAKFDKAKEYIHKWVPVAGTENYPPPIVEHEKARDRMLEIYRAALSRSETV